MLHEKIEIGFTEKLKIFILINKEFLLKMMRDFLYKTGKDKNIYNI